MTKIDFEYIFPISPEILGIKCFSIFFLRKVNEKLKLLKWHKYEWIGPVTTLKIFAFLETEERMRWEFIMKNIMDSYDRSCTCYRFYYKFSFGNKVGSRLYTESLLDLFKE